MSKGYEITVENCEACPFFERTIASTVVDWFRKSETQTGTCKHAADGRPFPWGRVHIDDPKKPPDRCPLREGLTTIRLKAMP